ncbi:MAG: hypothetical protein QF437_31795, partial [Planctomycetota bacterium]|nr:hypothetical protein [Planctomycetota bacterium]
YRQNYGFTNIVIGRKHADAPYHDGEAIWGDFDAQEIFNNLNGELLIEPINVGFAAFYESLGRVDLMSNHDDEKPVFISAYHASKYVADSGEGDGGIGVVVKVDSAHSFSSTLLSLFCVPADLN